jgi:hypothetical protein
MTTVKKKTLIGNTKNGQSRDGSVGIATVYGLDGRMIGIRFPAVAVNFFLRRCVEADSGAHPASYSMVTGGSFPEE